MMTKSKFSRRAAVSNIHVGLLVTQVCMPRLAMAFIAAMFSISFTVPALANSAGTTNNSNAETPVATSTFTVDAASAEEDDDDECGTTGFKPFIQSLADRSSSLKS